MQWGTPQVHQKHQPQLTGANAQQLMLPPPPLRYDNSYRRDAVNQVINQGQDGRANPGNNGRNDYREHHQSYCVFTTEQQDKQSVQRRHMEVNAVMPAVPRYMPWTDQEITWSIKDHPKIMPSPGTYALVLDPMFIVPNLNVRFSKVLIDNGSSINIMYKDTMHKLEITENMLQATRTTFHGIVPGISCEPIGKVRVDVLFDTRDNYRTENLEFEVVNLESAYHALLGRPALNKFMASCHISYLKMKLPRPNGVITITGDFRRSIECASAGSNLAESLVIAQEKRKIQEVAVSWWCHGRCLV